MKNKQTPIAIAVGLILVIGLVLTVWAKRNQAAKPKVLPTLAPSPTPIQARSMPKFKLSYTNQTNTLKFELETADDFWQQFAKVTYEFMYTSTKGPRGLIGEFRPDFLIDKIFFGSESSGKRVYDTGIETGQITFHLEKDNGESISIGPFDVIFGGWLNQDTWQTDAMTLKLEKKTRAKFIVYQNSGDPNLSDNPKMIISFQPINLKSSASLSLSGLSNVTKIQHSHEAVAFASDNGTVEFSLNSEGDYLIY